MFQFSHKSFLLLVGFHVSWQIVRRLSCGEKPRIRIENVEIQ